jgi:uncharacterized protein (DUF1501 family)
MTALTNHSDLSCSCEEGGRVADTLSRRSLLGRMGALGAAGVVTSVVGSESALQLAFADAGYTGDTVVVLSLRGGFDGLSAVVPLGDPAYAAARPSIGISASRALPLDSMFGLHPALAPLRPLYTAGRLAFVHAVGQPTRTRSHFAAMQEMENAAPGSTLRTGWIDRMVGVSGSPTMFSAVAVGAGGAPAAMIGPNPELVLTSVDDFTLSAPGNAAEQQRWATALRGLHASAPAAIKTPALATLSAVGTTSRLKEQGYTPAGGAVYPKGELGEALREVARLVKAGLGLRMATLDVGDWDMHAGMGTSDKGWMFDRLTTLGQALAAFATDLGEKLSDVTLVTLSEFGRRVAENGSGGLDHGHGNVCMVLGGGIAGGRVFGRWPGLAADRLDDGDLAGTTDYRTILAEILEKRARLSSAGVFPGLAADRLGLARARG